MQYIEGTLEKEERTRNAYKFSWGNQNHRRHRKTEHLKSRKMLKCANIKLPPIDWDVIKKATQTKNKGMRAFLRFFFKRQMCKGIKIIAETEKERKIKLRIRSAGQKEMPMLGFPTHKPRSVMEIRLESIWGNLLMLTGVKCDCLWATYINVNINYSPYMRMTNLRLMSGLWCCRPQSFSIHILLATSQ